MLRRVHRPAKPLICLCARSYTVSTTSIYPYNKLRAFPFVMSPEKAQRLAANYAQYLCGGHYFLRSMMVDILPATWNIKFKRPISFAAVYFPAWLISGTMVSRMVFYNAKEITGFYFSKIAYIPGCDLRTMSAAQFWAYELNNVEPLPLTENLLTQHGLRVNCVPFNTSPFSVLDLLSSAGEQGFTVKRGVKVFPSRIDDFTAMPVLLPLYVATYADENNDSGDVLTLFIQAHSNGGKIKANQDHLIKFLLKKDNKEPMETFLIEEGQEICNIRHAVARGAGLLRQIQNPNTVDCSIEGKDIDAYMARLLGSSENIRKLALMGSLETDDDSRIREMTAEEIKKRNDWYSSRDEMLDTFLEGIRKQSAAQEAASQEKAGSKTNIWARYAKSPNGSSAPTSSPNIATRVKKKKPGKGK